MTTSQIKPAITAVIRPAVLDDAVCLQQTCWPERPLDAITEFLQRTQKLAAQRRGTGAVAEYNGIVCGFGLLTLWPRTAEISDLIVAPAYRDQGIGTRMIDYLAGVAVNLNAAILEIGVAVTNPRALVLYQRLGFEAHHSIQIELGSGPETVLYLEKKLPD